MFNLTAKMFSKNMRNHLVYLLFLTFLIAAITLFSNLLTMQSSYINASGAVFDGVPNTLNVFSYDLLSFVMILLLIFLGFYAFQYYLNSQSKILSIFRLSGTNFYKILVYMLLQLIVIFLIASCLGFGLGNFFYQMINVYLSQLMGLPIQELKITTEAIVYIVTIVGIELIYLLLLTMGFVYRHEIKDLLGYRESFDPKKGKARKATAPHVLFAASGIFLVLYVVIVIVQKATYSGIFMANLLIISFAFPLLLKNTLSALLKKMKQMSKSTNRFIGLSHLDFDLRKMIGYLIFFAILLVVVATWTIQSYSVYENFVYNICVYLILSIIFLFTIVYQMVLNIDSRKRDFSQLLKLGKTKRDIKKIITIEVLGFFIILFTIAFLMPTISFISAIIYGNVATTIIIILLAFNISLFVLSYIVTKAVYNSVIKTI